MLSDAPHEVVIRFSERVDARASRSCSREFPRKHSAVSWPVLFLSLGCWIATASATSAVSCTRSSRRVQTSPGVMHTRCNSGPMSAEMVNAICWLTKYFSSLAS